MIAFYVPVRYKSGYERNIKWQPLKVLLRSAENVVMSLKFHGAEVRPQSIAQRNAQMFIGKIQQELKKSNCIVKNAVRLFMTILAMNPGESFVRMNAQTVRILKLKNEPVYIVVRFLRSLHLRLIFAVPGSVEMPGRKLPIGRYLKSFSASVPNVEKNFGESCQRLKSLVENSVLVNVKLILNALTMGFHRTFIILASGSRFGREYFCEMVLGVRNAALRAGDFISTIRNLSEMVGEKATIILSRFAIHATRSCTIVKNVNIILTGRAYSLLEDSPFVVLDSLIVKL